MTDAYTAAWLAEMWAPCPEWHQTKDERGDAAARNDLLRAPRNVALTCENGPAEQSGPGGAANSNLALPPIARRFVISTPSPSDSPQRTAR